MAPAREAGAEARGAARRRAAAHPAPWTLVPVGGQHGAAELERPVSRHRRQRRHGVYRSRMAAAARPVDERAEFPRLAAVHRRDERRTARRQPRALLAAVARAPRPCFLLPAW